MAKKTKNKGKAETPLMKQYNEIKSKHPDAMLLFRVGDFYETFGEDAVNASKILGIILTKRANGSASEVALAGFPHHSLNTYLPKLVRAGQRVAICDQLEDPKLTKTIVKRGVTDLVTPGVTLDDQVLESKENNYLAAIHFAKNKVGVAFLDISTGEFSVAEGNVDYIKRLLNNHQPKEVLFDRSKYHAFIETFGQEFYTFGIDEWAWSEDYTYDEIANFFKVKNLKGFGIEDWKMASVSAGVILHYLQNIHKSDLPHINGISRIQAEDFMWMDAFTIKSLELVQPAYADGFSLKSSIDFTQTAMGGRLLHRWILMPLIDVKKIQARQKIVEVFVRNEKLSNELRDELSEFGDIERIISKIATQKVSPKALLLLSETLKIAERIVTDLSSKENDLKAFLSSYKKVSHVVEKIQKTIHPDAPAIIGKGRLIADGVSEELDEYFKLSTNSKDTLLEIQQRESEATGIPSLKIAYNNVFGYYIEVRNTHKDKVPDSWVRKQTLVNAERYITEELKTLESKILEAEEKIGKLEAAIFKNLLDQLCLELADLQYNAKVIGQLDVLSSFAYLSKKFNYSKPEINESLKIEIIDGRHPVIEQHLKTGEEYVSNNLVLDNASQQIVMVTGPNMSGKSALLRQTALITLMAQMGSYVSAKKVKLGIVDKIFTRVGASDNISTGESTFMVEMNETSNILNNFSERSLILLDEIGRGTSTFDGVSIAWAIAEYLHEYPLFQPKTLFATHYHELNKMTDQFTRIKNFNVSVKQVNDKIIFLRKLQPGGSEHSFGINVAQLAGMPQSVIGKAKQILKVLEGNKKESVSNSTSDSMQLSFIQLDDPILEDIREELKELDINSLTPVEALMKLNEIKKRIN
jgi:DNA mismatch repair protein MutS